MKKFLVGRFHGLLYSIKGAYYLIRTEDAIKFQSFIALTLVFTGFYFEITATEWMFQLFTFGLVMGVEALNTAIEDVADFIHPEHNKKIGIIKDIGAGAVFLAAIFSIAIILIIYVPYFF
jgi:diacylglycerol kinase (ATP)